MGLSADQILATGASRLGFGCGYLMGGRNREHSRRLIDCALDLGIAYFDTARLYGDGHAERILGEIAPQNRDRIWITSKAGILPVSPSPLHRVWGKSAKIIHSATPGLASVFPAPKPLRPRFGVFGVSDVRASLEKSLSELNTDYLDAFLLHEFLPEHAEDDELIAYLSSLKNDGVVRHLGLATHAEATPGLVTRRPALGEVLQFANSLWNPNIDELSTAEDGLRVTHSVLGVSYRKLVEKLKQDEHAARVWREAADSDPASPAEIAATLLRHALSVNPNGIVLFSSSKPENIERAARVAEAPLLSEERIQALKVAIRQIAE